MRRSTLLVPLVTTALLALAGCQSHHPKLPAACAVKPVSGQCRASILRYWYDEGVGTCKGFVWGGCGGVVPFETLEACHDQCMPGLPMPEQPVLKQVAPPAGAKADTTPATPATEGPP